MKGQNHAPRPVLAVALMLAMLFCSVGAKKPGDSTGKAASETEDHSEYWRQVLQNYRDDDEVRQIMLVRYTGGTEAVVRYYVKLTDENNVWSLVFQEADACVGLLGIGKTEEGDRKTPTGDFGILTAFGIRRDPGTKLPYLDITPETYACDEAGEYYNRIISIKETGHECKGEDMFRLSPEYNYGLATDYNSECSPGKGSNIFVHCKGEKSHTSGCVAVSEENMRTILTTAEEGMRIVIGEN